MHNFIFRGWKESDLSYSVADEHFGFYHKIFSQVEKDKEKVLYDFYSRKQRLNVWFSTMKSDVFDEPMVVVNPKSSYRKPKGKESVYGRFRLETCVSETKVLSSASRVALNVNVMLTIAQQMLVLYDEEMRVRKQVAWNIEKAYGSDVFHAYNYYNYARLFDVGCWYFSLLSLKIAHANLSNWLEDGLDIARNLENGFLKGAVYQKALFCNTFEPWHLPMQKMYVYMTLQQCTKKHTQLFASEQKRMIMPRLTSRLGVTFISPSAHLSTKDKFAAYGVDWCGHFTKWVFELRMNENFTPTVFHLLNAEPKRVIKKKHDERKKRLDDEEEAKKKRREKRAARRRELEEKEFEEWLPPSSSKKSKKSKK